VRFTFILILSYTQRDGTGQSTIQLLDCTGLYSAACRFKRLYSQMQLVDCTGLYNTVQPVDFTRLYGTVQLAHFTGVYSTIQIVDCT
jgi:hypothetical protein